MNERVLVKWEQAMGAALERLRKVAWMSVIPALERIVVMLKEVEAWSLWCAAPKCARDVGDARSWSGS